MNRRDREYWEGSEDFCLRVPLQMVLAAPASLGILFTVGMLIGAWTLFFIFIADCYTPESIDFLSKVAMSCKMGVTRSLGTVFIDYEFFIKSLFVSTLGGTLSYAVMGALDRDEPSLKEHLKSVPFWSFTLLFPPSTVAYRKGIGLSLFASVLLTFFGYLPGLAHAVSIHSRDEDKPTRPEPKRSGIENGTVYVLVNPEIPDVVKIGHTTRTASIRAKELSRNTGVPGEYRVAYQFKASNPKRLEEKVHRNLSRYRVQNGEFFKIDADEAAETIRSIKSVPSTS